MALLVPLGSGTVTSRPILTKSGPNAWATFKQSPSSFHKNGINPLIVHSCQDDTMLTKYIPRVLEFLKWSLKQGATFRTEAEVDQWMADYMADACYGRGKGVDFGSSTFFGFLALFPEFKHKLDRSYRAYKGWKAIHVGGEGVGIPEEAVAILSAAMIRDGAPEASLITDLSFDCYLRSHEWCQIRVADVHDDGNLCSIMLGVAERGEKVKTGVRQGVVIDSPKVRTRLRHHIAKKAPLDHVFSMSSGEFHGYWERSKLLANLSWAGPEHSLRHAGASRDIEKGTRTLEQVRRRGRWHTLDSVQRYTKTWALVRARARMTAEQLAKGKKLVALLPPRVISN